MRAGREPRQADHDVELGRPPQAFSGASRLSGTHAAGASAPLSVGSISPTVPQIPENMIGRIGMNESGSALAASCANVGVGLGLMEGPHDESSQAATSDDVVVGHLLSASHASEMARHRRGDRC